jgi:hypothetical protein
MRLAALCISFALACLVAPAAASAQLFQVEGSFGSDQIDNPTAIATDAAGRVFVTDESSHRVEVFDSASGGNAYLGSFGEDLPDPTGIAIDNRQRIYVADGVRNQVIRYTSWNDKAEVSRVLGDPGTELGQFDDPQHIALSFPPDVYVADRNNVRVQWIASTGLPRAGFGVGDLNPPGFNSPHGIAREARSGALYVSSDEGGGGGVRLYDKRGLFLRTVAVPGSGAADISGPRGLALDRADRLLVADTGHGRVSLFGSATDGNPFLGSVDGLGLPVAVAFAPGAHAYVADAFGKRILRVRYDDADDDGVIDTLDNCPGLSNPAQRDFDRDGIGDDCDDNDDNDALPDAADPCPLSPPGHADANGDGCADPRSRITRPARLAGVASADKLGVARVEVAVARRIGGSRCRWYGGAVTRSCATPRRWLRARGTRSWHAPVRVRARGSYVVLSRAVQRGGLVERAPARASFRLR